MSAHSHELCGRMQGTCTQSADDLLEISFFHWSQRHMTLGDLSVYKHLPGNPGLTAHGEPVLENNIVLFLSCSFEEPAITASFLHPSLRSVLVVARNSNRELRESTASAITYTQVAEVLLMGSFWSHAESAQQQQKRSINHDHCHCTVSLSPNLPPPKFSSRSVFLWMLVLKQWISKWSIIGSEELTQANGTMMATGEFCLCQDFSASAWTMNCIISLHALGHNDPSSGALRNNAFVSTSTVKPELWRLDTAPRNKIWHLVLHSEQCICWIT